jgi:hypothetical protein
MALASCAVAMPTQAQVPTQVQVPTDLGFQPPPVGSPGNREAGGVRSDTCASVTERAGLTAIVPDTNVGLTTQASPQLFAYIPSNSADFAELRLLDEATGEDVYVSAIAMPPAPGSDYSYRASILSLPLPATVTLEPGKDYLWALLLVCNADNRAEDIVVTAVVQRASDAYLDTLPTEARQQLSEVASASPTERLTIYSEAGLWQDLLGQLAVLVDQDAATYGPLWADLLSDQGLEGIAAAPIVAPSDAP